MVKKHSAADLTKQIAGKQDPAAEWQDKDKVQTRELLMALLIKAADISNVALPFDISANLPGCILFYMLSYTATLWSFTSSFPPIYIHA